MVSIFQRHYENVPAQARVQEKGGAGGTEDPRLLLMLLCVRAVTPKGCTNFIAITRKEKQC